MTVEKLGRVRGDSYFKSHAACSDGDGLTTLSDFVVYEIAVQLLEFPLPFSILFLSFA